MKSLTGSQKVIEILNRIGHCASYNLVEEIETERTDAANEKDILTPSRMNMDANACTGQEFDNYDRFVETLAGKHILHGTVGIAYKTVKLEDSIDNNPSTNQENIETNPSATDFNIASTSSDCETGIHLSIHEQIIHNFNGKYSMGKTQRQKFQRVFKRRTIIFHINSEIFFEAFILAST